MSDDRSKQADKSPQNDQAGASIGGGLTGAGGGGQTGGIGLSTLTTDLTGVSAIDQQREDARQTIALIIVGTLCGLVLLAFLTLWLNSARTFAELKALLDLLVSPIVGLVGAVTGFYFGSSGAGNSGRR